jgi:hypothetical protein
MDWIQTEAPNAEWTSVASDASGNYLVACRRDGGTGNIYTNDNYGNDLWTQTAAPNANWSCVASDASGKYLVACVSLGNIYTNANYGRGAWTQTEAPNAEWQSVASDATGKYLVACNRDIDTGVNIYTNANYGNEAWTLQTEAPSDVLLSVASDATGKYLVVAGSDMIYTNTNYGNGTWITQTVAPGGGWQSVASDATGKYLVACRRDGGTGNIYTNDNYGNDLWTQAGAPTANWSSVASDASGKKLVAGVVNGYIYTNDNYGRGAWTQAAAPSAGWQSVASDATGTYLVACAFGGYIYINGPPAPNTNICFPAGTPVRTDQGVINIEHIDKKLHTIQRKPILQITKTVTVDKYLISFAPSSLTRNVPQKTTVMSKDHKIEFDGQLVPAERFLDYSSEIKKVKYSGELLYNILLDKHSRVNVNGIICETLHPENIIAKLYTNGYAEEERKNIIIQMNDALEKRDLDGYKCVLDKLQRK